MKKKYKFDYDNGEASAEFEIDTEKFTPELAKETLDFFSWDVPYDEDGDYVDEVLKKYAIEAVSDATCNNHNTYGVIYDFENKEGFCRLNGETGIKLLNVSGYEFDDYKLQVEVEEGEG